MRSALDLYKKPNLSALAFSKLAWNVILEHRNTFAKLAGCQFLMYAPFIFSAVFLEYVLKESSGAESFGIEESLPVENKPLDDGGVDMLAEFLIGAWIVDAHSESAGMLPLLAVGSLLLFMAYIFINSFIDGACVRACAEICAGRTLHWQRCLAEGGKKMVPIASLKVMIGLVVLASALSVWWAIRIIFGVGLRVGGFGTGLLTLVVCIPLVVAFSSAMTGAKSAIVVENMSAREALKRSIRLCKTDLLFIFCTACIFVALPYAVSLVLRRLTGVAAATTVLKAVTTFPLLSV